jgi:hypothetical protein
VNADTLRRWHGLVERARESLGILSAATEAEGLGPVDELDADIQGLEDLERELFEAFVDAVRREVA